MLVCLSLFWYHRLCQCGSSCWTDSWIHTIECHAIECHWCNSPYHILLSSFLIHSYQAVSSTYHQCLISKWEGKNIQMMPLMHLEKAKAPFIKRNFFNELIQFEEIRLCRSRVVLLPKWSTIVREDSLRLMWNSKAEWKKVRKNVPFPVGQARWWDNCLSLIAVNGVKLYISIWSGLKWKRVLMVRQKARKMKDTYHRGSYTSLFIQ